MKNIYKEYKHFFKEISRNYKLYLGALFFVTLLSSAYNILYAVYMNNIGYNTEVSGYIMSLRTFGVALAAVPVALVSQRYNKKNTLIIGMLILITSSLVLLNVRSIAVMQVASLIFGFGHASIMILQAPIIFETTDEEHRIMAFSVAFVFMSIATTLSNFFLGNISNYLSQLFGSEITGNLLVLNGATLLVIVGIIISLFFNGESMLSSNKTVTIVHDTLDVFKSYFKLLKGDTLKYIMQVALVGMGAGMIVPFFSVYLKLTLHVNDGQLGNIMAISSIGTIVGGILAPIIAKNFGRVRSIMAFQLLSIPFLLTISFPQGILLMTFAFFFRTGLMNMANPLISSLAMEIVDDHSKTHMSGLQSLTNNLFRGFGITIGGSLMYRFTYNTPYYFTIVLYLLGTLIIYKVFYKKEAN